jgi:hypothetical protein
MRFMVPRIRCRVLNTCFVRAILSPRGDKAALNFVDDTQYSPQSNSEVAAPADFSGFDLFG